MAGQLHSIVNCVGAKCNTGISTVAVGQRFKRHACYSVAFAAILHSPWFSYGPLDVASGLSRYLSLFVVARSSRSPGHHLLISTSRLLGMSP